MTPDSQITRGNVTENFQIRADLKFRTGQTQRLDIVTVDGRITLEDLIKGYEDHLAVLRQANTSLAAEYRYVDADLNEFFPVSVRAWDFSGETPRTVLLYSAE